MTTYARIGKAAGVEAPLYMRDGDKCWRWPFEKRTDGQAAPKLSELTWVAPTASLDPKKFKKVTPSAEDKAAFTRSLTPEGTKAVRDAAKAKKAKPVVPVNVPGQLITTPPAYLLKTA